MHAESLHHKLTTMPRPGRRFATSSRFLLAAGLLRGPVGGHGAEGGAAAQVFDDPLVAGGAGFVGDGVAADRVGVEDVAGVGFGDEAMDAQGAAGGADAAEIVLGRAV